MSVKSNVERAESAMRKALINEGLLSLITKAVDKHNEEYDWHTEGKELTNERTNARSITETCPG